MLWPHTKTPVPAKVGPEFFIEMWKSSPAKHKATLTNNFVSYIITPPLSGKLHELCPSDDLKAKDARPFDLAQGINCTDTSFTNVIYIILSALPSRKISRIMPAFLHSEIQSAKQPISYFHFLLAELLKRGLYRMIWHKPRVNTYLPYQLSSSVLYL